MYSKKIYYFGALLTAFMISNTVVASYRSADSERGAYFWVDYLRWKAEEDQLVYALVSETGFQPPQGDILIKEPCFQWDSGVRVGGGYQFCSEWDFFVAWTHFKESTSSSVTAGAQQVLAVALNSSLGAAFGSSASSTWCLKFDTVDIDIATSYGLTNCLAVRPYMGLKWAGIKQNQDIRYEDVVINQNTSNAAVARINNFS